MAESTSARSKRPSFAKGALQRNPSYLDDHLEYRTQTGPATSIDGIIEQPTARISTNSIPSLGERTTSSRKSIVGAIAPSPAQQPQDFESIHTLSHTNCIQDSSQPERLVATIYYNTASHTQQPGTTSPSSGPSIAEGLAPTSNISNYPLEPPLVEGSDLHLSDLSHIYGSYISQLCLTHFLATLDSLLIHNVPSQRRLLSTHRCLAPSSTKPRIMEVTFSPPPNPTYLPFEVLGKHESIYKFEREWSCEVVLQKYSIFRRHKRLCVFDMDSTLIQQEVIDEIASFIGVQDQVSAITERAMNGELDFSASLKARVALLKGVPADVFERLKPRITITPGARELCRTLKRLGLTLAVASGGFQPLADWLAAELGLDYAFANHLVSDPVTQTLTGDLDPNFPIVNAEYKKFLLEKLAADLKLPMAQTMAVGDGANDIPMLQASGMGIAWKAKAKVQMEAPGRLNGARDMLDLVYLLGVSEAEVMELLAV